MAAALITAIVTAGCGVARTPDPRGNGGPTPAEGRQAGCQRPPVTPVKGAPGSLGLDARGVPAPRWSSPAGAVAAVNGQTVFTILGSDCVLALDAASGHQQWSWAGPGHPQIMGVTAGQGIVIVATGHFHGTPPAAVYALTDRITALAPGTGGELWSLAVSPDGQSVPAAVAGHDVIVTEANGTVAGLDAATGSRRWTDPLPAGCRPPAGTGQGPQPAAALLDATQAAVTVGYQCPLVAAIDPATGAHRWTWRSPQNWSVEGQAPAGSAGHVLAFVVQGPGTAAPGRATWPLPPGGYQTDQVVALSQATGHPLWELGNVPTTAGVYGGSGAGPGSSATSGLSAGPGQGALCVDAPYAVECVTPQAGTKLWQWLSPVAPDPANVIPGYGVAASDNELYTIAPTPAAAKIDTESTTERSAPGTFVLRVMDMITGQVTRSQPLPAYYGGASGVVTSVASPPGVAAVTGSTVLITPELGESDVVEAFGPT
jgi:outer membrane protein assembly factor BamB